MERTEVSQGESATAQAGSRAPGGVALTSLCGHLLRRCYQVHRSLWAEEVGRGLTSRQYAVLGAVGAYPGADQRKVGTLVFLDRTSTMDVIRRLEGRDWLERQRDVTDGRRHALTVTAAGTRALDEIEPAVARVQDGLLAPVAERDRDPLLDALRRLGRPGRSTHTEARRGSPLVLPGHLLRRAQQVHTELFADELGGRLTGPQYAALHVVVESPGVSQATLAERAAFDRSTVGAVVGRLRDRGWVSRVRDPADARRWVLTPTAGGEQAAAETAPGVAAVQERLMRDLDPASRVRLLRALRAVARLG